MNIYKLTQKIIGYENPEMCEALKISRQNYFHKSKLQKVFTIDDLKQCLALCRTNEERQIVIDKVLPNLKRK